MAILSAQRGDKSKKENAARSRQLDKDIRGAGLPEVYLRRPLVVLSLPGKKGRSSRKVGERSHVVSSG